MAQITRRAFAIKQWPRFGRGPYSDDSAPATVRSSPYFWWFRFLQLNDDYEAALNGRRNQIRRSVVKAFGPVRGIDFKTWWSGHSELFAEPHTKYSMKIATSASDLVPIGDTDGFNLVVPLDWNARALQLSFSRILNKLVEQGRVRTEGNAFFKIGSKWNIAALDMAYRIYTTRKAAELKGERLAWADVAIRARLPYAIGLKERDRAVTARHKRMTVTVLALRHNHRALGFIAASATNSFPA
jgi:hypothetical protein